MEVNLPAGGMKDPVPRCIHQTWKTTEVPDRYKAFQKTFLDHHPHWEYKLWTDEDNDKLIEEHYPWFLDMYRSYPHNIQRVDAARYFIMYHYGGVYADLDMQCLTPLDPLVDQIGGVILGQEGQTHSNGTQRIGNAILFSSRHHPFWLHVFQSLMENHKFSNTQKIGTVFITTGPSFLHEVYLKYPQGITVMPAVSFYPLPWHKPEQKIELVQRRQYPKSWTAHHWEGVWRNSPRQVSVEYEVNPAHVLQMSFILPRNKREGWGGIEQALSMQRLPNEKLVAKWAEILTPGDIVIQVCAYIGQSTIPLAKLVGDTGQVHAFEPDSRARTLLCETVRANRLKNVQIYDCILTSQQVRMYRVNKINPLQPHRIVWRAQQPNGIDCTLGTPADAMLVTNVTLMHIEVCGEEVGVLQGAEVIIKRDRPILTIDIWSDQRRQEYGTPVRQDQVFGMLDRLGYNYQLIANSVYLCTPEEMDNLVNAPTTTTNSGAVTGVSTLSASGFSYSHQSYPQPYSIPTIPPLQSQMYPQQPSLHPSQTPSSYYPSQPYLSR